MPSMGLAEWDARAGVACRPGRAGVAVQGRGRAV
jgi:hypothetical protein